MQRLRVAVVRGGTSDEFDLSLKTGRRVLDELARNHRPADFIVDRNGKWYSSGREVNPYKELNGIDVVFNSIHGTYGEDGKLQGLLDEINKPYIGSQGKSAYFSLNKEYSKKIFERQKIKTPKYYVVSRGEDLPKVSLDIFRALPLPFVIKPITGGNSIGISIARSYGNLLETLISTLQYVEKVIVEEFIEGYPATCGVLENFRGEKCYALTPQQINIRDKKLVADLKLLAINAHKALALNHFSRTDFVVSPRRGIYVLEINAIPGLAKECPYPASLEDVGSSVKEYINHSITLLDK